MLVSYDEHIRDLRNNPSMSFIQNHANYARMTEAERYAFIIDTVASWYIGFYLRWRTRGMTLHPFEQRLREERAYFGRLIAELTGEPADEQRLDAALVPPARAADRFNVGRFGRAAERFPDKAKRQLENRIFRHPDLAQLEVLLWELPWEVSRLERRSPLDGEVVVRASDGIPFFVSRGVAYQVLQHSWVLSRTGERRTPRVVDPHEFDGCALGEPLI
jgi:hypothetical protein